MNCGCCSYSWAQLFENHASHASHYGVSIGTNLYYHAREVSIFRMMIARQRQSMIHRSSISWCHFIFIVRNKAAHDLGPSHILWLRGEVPAGQKSANDGLLKGGRSSASDASVFGKLAAKQQHAHGLIFSCVHDNHEISQEEFESFEVLRDSSVLNVRSFSLRISA